MNVEPAQGIISVRAHVQCTHGYGGSLIGLIVGPLALLSTVGNPASCCSGLMQSR
jgi:hypothetical protein